MEQQGIDASMGQIMARNKAVGFSTYGEQFNPVQVNQTLTGIAQELHSAFDEADWKYLMEEFPSAIRQSKEGISRVTSIVKAMKEFSRPSSNADHAIGELITCRSAV